MTPHLTSTFPALLAAALLAPAGSASAALAITNGSFGTVNTGGSTVNGGGWFESTVNTWAESSWANPISYPAAFTTPNGVALLMDSLNDGSYVYQSLGTLEAGTTSILLSADFLQKSDSGNNSVRFDLFSGNSFIGANGTDIFNAAGVTNRGNITLTAAQQGLTAGGGDTTRANGVSIGSFDVSSLSAGSQLWLRITDAADGIDDSGSGGDLMMDNLALTAVPEPSAALLAGLGMLALLRRRR